MVLPGIVKLLLCGALAGALGGICGGLAPLFRSAALGLLLTLAVPVLNRLSRRAGDEEDERPLLFVPSLVCGIVVGALYAGIRFWLNDKIPYSLTAPHIAGWAEHLSGLLFGVLMLQAYRLRVLSARWHAAMPFLVWLGASLADGVRFLPLVLRVPDFAGPAFLGGIANVSVLSFGWVLALRLHDPEYRISRNEDTETSGDEPRPFRLRLLAARVLAAAALLVGGAYLFARQVGFVHLWHTEVVWNHPELAERLTGSVYSAELAPGAKNQLDLRRTDPERVWPALLERSARGDAILHGDVLFVGEHTAIRAWNLETGVMTIEFPMEWASIALSPDGQRLACVGNHAGDPIDDLRLAILRAEDGTMVREARPGFRREGLCWTADGQLLVGVVGPDKDTSLAVLAAGSEETSTLGPGTRPHLDLRTGDILFLHQDALWRRDLTARAPVPVADGMAGVRDYSFTADPSLLLVARSRLHRFGAVRHYLLLVDTAASPNRRHVLSARHIPSWCIWTP